MNVLQNILDLLQEAEQRCQLLSECLPKRIDYASISIVPLKAIDYREVLIWRTEELARTAYEMFNRDELVSAITLTRACMETVAAMWFLQQEIRHVIDTKDLENINEVLMRLLMGSRNKLTDFESFNVLKFVKKINIDINGFESSYNSLCEYAHPNWSGTSSLYSKPNSEKGWKDYGKNIRGKESVAVIGLTCLNTSLNIFEDSYNEVGELMPDFIKICEQNLTSQK